MGGTAGQTNRDDDSGPVAIVDLHHRPRSAGGPRARGWSGIAARAGAKRLVLSHLMTRSERHRDDVVARVRASHAGPVVVASDLACVSDDL